MTLIHLGSKPEGVESLTKASVQWGDIDKHESLRVPTKGALEEVGQLGVPIGDVALLVERTEPDDGKLAWNRNYEH